MEEGVPCGFIVKDACFLAFLSACILQLTHLPSFLKGEHSVTKEGSIAGRSVDLLWNAYRTHQQQ